jgi:hypothetical protein
LNIFKNRSIAFFSFLDYLSGKRNLYKTVSARAVQDTRIIKFSFECFKNAFKTVSDLVFVKTLNTIHDSISLSFTCNNTKYSHFFKVPRQPGPGGAGGDGQAAACDVARLAPILGSWRRAAHAAAEGERSQQQKAPRIVGCGGACDTWRGGTGREPGLPG